MRTELSLGRNFSLNSKTKMPLNILIPLIIFGIFIVLLAVRLSTRNSDSIPLTDETALREYLYSYPNDVVGKAHISQNQRTAWIELDNDQIVGLISKFGSGTIVRRVEPHHILHKSREGDSLSIKLYEFAMPPITLTKAVDELENRLTIKNTTNQKATAN